MKTIEKMISFKTALVISVIIVLLSSSCNKNIAANKSPKQYYYTCPMHTEIFEINPGRCRKCGMELEQRSLDNYSRNSSHGGHSGSGGGGGGCH